MSLEKVWRTFESTNELATQMINDGKKIDSAALTLALLQVIAWELRTAREERTQ